MIQGNKQKGLENTLRCTLSLLRLAWQPLPVRRGRAPSGRLASLSLFHTLTHTPLLLLFAVCQTERQCEQKQDSPSKRRARILSPPKRYPRRRRACLQQQQQHYHQHSSLASSVCPSVCGYYCSTVFCLLSSPLCLYCTADTDTHGFCCCCCDVFECMFLTTTFET